MDSGSIIESGMPKKVISGTGPACPKCEQRFGAVYNDVETGTVLRQCGACGNRFPDPAEEAPAPLSAEDTALGLTQVLHSNIVAIGYNKATAVILVRYHDGKLYRFEAVTPAAYQSILTAASPGAALYQMYGKKGKLTNAAAETPKTPVVPVEPPPALAPGESTLPGNDHRSFRMPLSFKPPVVAATTPAPTTTLPPVSTTPVPTTTPAPTTPPAPTTTLPPANTTPAPAVTVPTELPPASSSK